MRPAYFENFTEIRQNNVLTIKQKKEEGVKVVGIYCLFCPRELVLAAGAIPVSLCGTSETPIAAAEKDLPRNLCPLIKSSYGFAVTDTCPYFHFSDLVIGETTCDGKKKAFEIMQKIKPVHVMQLPQMPERPSSAAMMLEEIKELKKVIEEQFEVSITEESLRQAIHLTNEEARAMRSLFELNTQKPALISGTDLLTAAFQVQFNADRWEGIAMVDRLVQEIRQAAADGYCVGDNNTPRILITGTPIGLGSEKVITLVEECGGIVVTLQSCGGYSPYLHVIDEEDPRDPLILLAEKYLGLPCSIMSPNPKRREVLKMMIEKFQVDGIIDLTWQACHTFNVESYWIEDLVKNQLGKPFLHLETDYSSSDRESLRVRIEAFLEMI